MSPVKALSCWLSDAANCLRDVSFLTCFFISLCFVFFFFFLWVFSPVTRQVIQTFPPLHLELPLSLLSRLLLCDPARSVFHLRRSAAAFFFFLAPPRSAQSAGSEGPPGPARSATWLLSQLLQQEELWDSAVELLILLSQIACCSSEGPPLELRLEAPVLLRALRHPHCQVKATACRLLGSLNPFGPAAPHAPLQQPAIFTSMVDCLADCCVPVRRMACRAVGNWLGFVAVGLSAGRHGDPGDGEREWLKEARRTGGALASLLGDPDALTRRHCCEALGNLRHLAGAVDLLLAEDAFPLLLRAACADTHSAVRQAAAATLSLYCSHGRVRQVMRSRLMAEGLPGSPQRVM